MSNVIKVDLEDAYSYVTNDDVEIKNIDYSIEWLTKSCVAKAIEEMNSIKTDFDAQVLTIKDYLDELDYISTITPPDVEVENDEDVEELNLIGLEDEAFLADDVIEEETEVVTEEETEVVTEEVTEAVTQGSTEPRTQPRTQPPTEPRTQPRTQPPTEPRTQPPTEVQPFAPIAESDIDYGYIKDNETEFIYYENGKLMEEYLDVNTKFTIVDGVPVNDLIKIKLENGVEGYIKVDNIIMKSDALVISQACIANNTVNTLDMKLTIAQDSATIGLINLGEKFDIIGVYKDLDIVKIRTSAGMEGYVSSKYLYIYVSDGK